MNNRITAYKNLAAVQSTYKAKKRRDVLASGPRIFIFDEIGHGPGLYSAKQFSQELKSLGNPRSIRIEINSPGGSLIEGLAISDKIRSMEAQTTAVVFNAFSVASVIALSCDRRQISANGTFMLHEARAGIDEGTSTELRERADLVDTMTNRMANFYSEVLKKPKREIQKVMAAETWFDADESIRFGLAHNKIQSYSLAARGRRRRRTLVAKANDSRASAFSWYGSNSQNTWREKVASYRAKGKSTIEAIKQVDKDCPGLREKMISEDNKN